MTGVWLTGKCSSDSKEHTQLISAAVSATTLYSHYKISQFYRRKYSVGVWLPVRWWIIYRRLHRRNMSVGFPFVGNTIVCHYIGRKNKKTFADGFTDGNCAPKKKVSRLIYTDGFIPSVIVWHTDRFIPSVNLSVSVWNTDRKYPFVNLSVIVASTVKYRRIKFVGKVVGEAVIPTEYIRL